MKIIIKNNSLIKEIGLQDFDEVAKSEKPYIIKFTNFYIFMKSIYVTNLTIN